MIATTAIPLPQWPIHTSVAYFCRDCGEVWARCTVVDPFGLVHPFEAIHVQCAAHVEKWWDGTFHLPWDTSYCEQIPEEVLRWEIVQLAVILRTGRLDKFLEN